jgi:hypothetical protein
MNWGSLVCDTNTQISNTQDSQKFNHQSLYKSKLLWLPTEKASEASNLMPPLQLVFCLSSSSCPQIFDVLFSHNCTLLPLFQQADRRIFCLSHKEQWTCVQDKLLHGSIW